MLLSTPLALRKTTWSLWWLELPGWVPPTSWSILCLPQSTLQILSFFYMYCDMKRLESKELRNYYYSFLMIVYHQHTSPTPDLVIPTCVCYTFATMNYCSLILQVLLHFKPSIHYFLCQGRHSHTTPATYTNSFYSSRISSRVTCAYSFLRDLYHLVKPSRCTPPM